MFDRHLEVAGHARGQFEALRIVALYPLELGLQTRESLVRVRAKRRNRHEPHEFQAIGGLGRGAHSVDRLGVADVDASALYVAVETDLDIDAKRRGRRLPVPPRGPAPR
jgi:hypothetical protein